MRIIIVDGEALARGVVRGYLAEHPDKVRSVIQ